MNDTYSGKNVVITGGSSGIGFATAKLLVDAGARVVITGRSQTTLDAATQRLGKNALAVRGDVASLPDLDALAAHVRDHLGRERHGHAGGQRLRGREGSAALVGP